MVVLIVVLCFILASVFMVFVSAKIGSKRVIQQAKTPAAKKVGGIGMAPPKRLLIHSINDDRCTGCEACITVCPTDVLELQENKSRVLRFSDCIQCEQCVTSCPTAALVMHYEGTAPPPLRLPALDDYYQATPGLYLIGEAAGKPLVKNSSNLGRAVVEHMIVTGMQSWGDDRAKKNQYDVLIVGSGPAGLSAALSCINKKLSYVIIEKDELIASTIARYPKGKHVMAEPYDVRCVGLLPVWDSQKDELLAAWRTIIDRTNISVQTREAVEDITRDPRGYYHVKTTKRDYIAQSVVLGIGTRGKPRKLGIPGESLTKVSPLLTDPADHKGQRVLVVGGGDSAVEAAIALGAHSQVTLSYRGKQLSRCKAKNRQQLDELERYGRVRVVFSSVLTEIQDGNCLLKVGAEEERLPNDHVFVCIGGDAPVKWLEKVGVRFEETEHMSMRPPTDQVVEALTGPLPEMTVERAGGGVSSAVMVQLDALEGAVDSRELSSTSPRARRRG
jgi:thioredoxin reductase/NAD-dependent dihydropyrimidine dehydrogenase PreA subunit